MSNIFKYPNLKPKDKLLEAGKVDVTCGNDLLISKQWNLPPRIKPGRKAGDVTIPSSKSKSDDRSHLRDEISDLEKRKVQNREAQRAYRERKANRMADLEHTLNKWKLKCTELIKELEFWKHSYKEFNEEMTQQLEKYKNENHSLKLKISSLEAQIACQNLHAIEISSNACKLPITFQKHATDNSRSMVRLSLEARISALRNYKDLENDELSLVRGSMPFTIEYPPDPDQKCGFCSDGTACVCT